MLTPAHDLGSHTDYKSPEKQSYSKWLKKNNPESIDYVLLQTIIVILDV